MHAPDIDLSALGVAPGPGAHRPSPALAIMGLLFVHRCAASTEPPERIPPRPTSSTRWNSLGHLFGSPDSEGDS